MCVYVLCDFCVLFEITEGADRLASLFFVSTPTQTGAKVTANATVFVPSPDSQDDDEDEDNGSSCTRKRKRSGAGGKGKAEPKRRQGGGALLLLGGGGTKKKGGGKGVEAKEKEKKRVKQDFLVGSGLSNPQVKVRAGLGEMDRDAWGEGGDFVLLF